MSNACRPMRLATEALETRQLMAADVTLASVADVPAERAVTQESIAPLQNDDNPVDVDADGSFTRSDIQLVVDALNRTGPRPITKDVVASTNYVDVNGDNTLSPADVLILVNEQAERGFDPPSQTIPEGEDSVRRRSGDPQGSAEIPLPVWSNPVDPRDVNNDGRFSDDDIVVVRRALNRTGPRPLGTDFVGPRQFIDTNADGNLTSADVLFLVNEWNLKRAPALAVDSLSELGHLESTIDQLAFDVAGAYDSRD